MRYMLCVVIVMTTIAYPTAVRPDDWPAFRGPTGQGHAQRPLPVHWGPDKNIAWKQVIPGHGWSSPVVYRERIYLTSAITDEHNKADRRDSDVATSDLSLHVICLDARTGKILWNVEVIRQPKNKVARKPPWSDGYAQTAAPTPIVAGKRLYAHFCHVGTVCLDLDGTVVWRNTDLPYHSAGDDGGSPLLVDDLIVLNIDEDVKQTKCVLALEQATGKVRWRTDRLWAGKGDFAFSMPLLIDVKGQRQIVCSVSDGVEAYDPKTGKGIWRVRQTGHAVSPSPVFGHGLVFALVGNSSLVTAIRPDGQGDVTATHVVWKKRFDISISSPLVNGNELYVVDAGGMAACFDAKTGKVHWKEQLTGNSNFYPSPLFAHDKIYFQSNKGIGYVVKADTKYELLAKNSLNERTCASYAAADGAIFLRTLQHLYRIEKRQR